jgi:class 3 adenylate cyclase
VSGPRSGLVAVLFTDLVGSTELMSTLGDRAFDDLRRTHFAALARVVAAHGGEEVKNTGDGIMAVFPSAADAVEGAVAMQQATARQRTTSPIAIRVGVAVGDATLEGGDVFGTPVVEAARLVAAARPGQILATAVARALAGGRSDADFADLGPVELKGLPEPVPICEVVWQPTGPAIPLPGLVTDMGRIFVGRDGDLGRLTQLWKEAVAGERRVVFLAGEPGVGKTRLAAELAGAVHGAGGLVLAGRCDEDLGVPYQPFVEALRHFVDHAGRPDLAPRLGRYGGELVRLVPELADPALGLAQPLSSDPATERYRLFDAVAGWLATAAADQPVLLVLDDLQWAAKPTLLLLRHVVGSSEEGGLLLVGTYRDTELAYDHPLVEVLADLRRREGVERLALSGLDSSGVAAFMEQAAGHVLAEDDLALARAIHNETEGNPFFVREVFRHLAETGAIERREGGWGTSLPVEELGIPEGVREVVGRRLARLSKETNEILRVASVVGADFELSVLQRAHDIAEDDLLTALEEAARSRLILELAEAGRYRFAHALVRDTLYDALSAARRVTLHRRLAEAIEHVHASALDDHLPALARHWARASVPGATAPKAVEYATRAGHRALAQLAHDEAVAYYRQALDLLTAAEGPVDETARLELLLSLGEAEHRAGDRAHRETLLHAADLARRAGDAAALARAALAGTRGLLPTTVARVDQEKVEALEAAVAAVGHDDPAARARLLATLGVELVFAADWRRCLALSDEAVALARSLGEPDTLARVLLARNFPTCVPGLLDERLADTAELLTVVADVADPALVAEAHLFRGRTAFEAADIVEADRCFSVADRLSAGLGQPALRWRVAYIQGARAIFAGRFAEAERLLSASRDLGRVTGQPDADWIFSRQLACLRLAQDRMDDETLNQLETVEHAVPVPFSHSVVARAAFELGRYDHARATLARFTATSVPFDIYWIPTMVNLAVMTARLSDAGQTEILERSLRPYAGQAVPLSAVPAPSVAHHLGLLSAALGRLAQAEDDFAAAAAIHERIGAPHWLAASRLELARLLVRRGRPDDGPRVRDLLGLALATAREMGLANIEREAVALLASP